MTERVDVWTHVSFSLFALWPLLHHRYNWTDAYKSEGIRGVCTDTYINLQNMSCSPLIHVGKGEERIIDWWTTANVSGAGSDCKGQTKLCRELEVDNLTREMWRGGANTVLSLSIWKELLIILAFIWNTVRSSLDSLQWKWTYSYGLYLMVQ